MSDRKREGLLAKIVYYKKAQITSRFEEDSLMHFKRNKVNAMMKAFKDRYAKSIEERRSAIIQLYKEDALKIEALALASIVSPEQKMESMRQRVHVLKVVDEKLNQQWVNNCDELRSLHSKMLMLQIAGIRLEQVAEADVRKVKDAETDKHYNVLWEQDRQKKIMREQADADTRLALQANTTTELGIQRQQLLNQKSNLASLKQHEHALIQTQLAQLALEQTRAMQQKHVAQQQTREDLDRFNRRKIRATLKAKKDSLAIDLQFLENLRALEAESKRESGDRRDRVRNDAMEYMVYLDSMKEEAREAEAEREEMYQKESDAQWDRRTKKWDDEKRKRDTLLRQVCEGRKLQIEASLERVKQDKAQVGVEREDMRVKMEDNVAYEREKQDKLDVKAGTHLRALDAQIDAGVEMKRLVREIQRMTLDQETEMKRVYEEKLENERRRILNGGVIH